MPIPLPADGLSLSLSLYPELQHGDQRLFILVAELGGCWKVDVLVRQLARLGSGRPCAAGPLSCRFHCLDAEVVGHAVDCGTTAVQHAVGRERRGWSPSASTAQPAGPSRIPLR